MTDLFEPIKNLSRIHIAKPEILYDEILKPELIKLIEVGE